MAGAAAAAAQEAAEQAAQEKGRLLVELTEAHATLSAAAAAQTDSSAASLADQLKVRGVTAACLCANVSCSGHAACEKYSLEQETAVHCYHIPSCSRHPLWHPISNIE